MHTMGMDGTKWQIFNVAIDMFADKSFHSVSMRDIARKVGIKASSIYNHFLSKEEVLTTIFAYYDYYRRFHTPNLDKLLEIADSDLHPRLVLKSAVSIFDPEIQVRMDKIVLIAAKATHDMEQADELLHEALIKAPQHIIGTLLERMVQNGKLEQMDVPTFLTLFCNFCYASALRMYTSYPMTLDEYRNGLDALAALLPVSDKVLPLE